MITLILNNSAFFYKVFTLYWRNMIYWQTDIVYHWILIHLLLELVFPLHRDDVIIISVLVTLNLELTFFYDRWAFPYLLFRCMMYKIILNLFIHIFFVINKMKG